jgi:hypothetical protein
VRLLGHERRERLDHLLIFSGWNLYRRICGSVEYLNELQRQRGSGWRILEGAKVEERELILVWCGVESIGVGEEEASGAAHEAPHRDIDAEESGQCQIKEDIRTEIVSIQPLQRIEVTARSHEA